MRPRGRSKWRVASAKRTRHEGIAARRTPDARGPATLVDTLRNTDVLDIVSAHDIIGQRRLALACRKSCARSVPCFRRSTGLTCLQEVQRLVSQLLSGSSLKATRGAREAA